MGPIEKRPFIPSQLEFLQYSAESCTVDVYTFEYNYVVDLIIYKQIIKSRVSLKNF